MAHGPDPDRWPGCADDCDHNQPPPLPPAPPTIPAPLDPSTPMEEQAAYVHETYLAYQHAGFPEERAFQIVCLLLHHALDLPPDGPGPGR